IHCQGSTSFTMSAIAGLIPQVDTIISNAVSLHPVPPFFSRIKLKYAVPFVALFTKYLNPHWGVEATGLVQKAIVAVVKLFHHECDNTPCKMVSFSYGTGFPALWLHENLNDETHEWLKDEFKNVPMHFFKYMNKYVQKGHLLGLDNLNGLIEDFTAQKPDTKARFIFFCGEKNLCFLPQSQRNSYAYFNDLNPGLHSFYALEKYSHLDVFMGKDAYKDVFPIMMEELNKPLNNK
ncbi:MAG: esterase, partial [Gammaproteobacteria bacterium]|nr:esterase [Gammaproteobacteria bacterium]